MLKLKKGSGIPLVFLHGFLGSPQDFIPLCSYLPECTCIALNLPGHNHTPFDPEFVIDLPRFHLIGYSLGGRIALQQFRHRAESLTLISTHPGLKTEEEKEKRLKTDAMWADRLLKLPIDEFLDRWYDQSVFKPFRPDLSMRRLHNVQDLARALMHYSLAKQKHFEIDHGIVGERDEKFCALYENPTIIPDAGHMVHLENPKALAQTLCKRLKL